MNPLTNPHFTTRLIYAAIFLPFSIIIGELIHRRGRAVIDHAFGSDTPAAASLSALLHIGWYLLCTGLLLWNFGVGGGYDWYKPPTLEQQISDVSVRLGVCVFVVGVLHGFNIVALSLFHRGKKT